MTRIWRLLLVSSFVIMIVLGAGQGATGPVQADTMSPFCKWMNLGLVSPSQLVSPVLTLANQSVKANETLVFEVAPASGYASPKLITVAYNGAVMNTIKVPGSLKFTVPYSDTNATIVLTTSPAHNYNITSTSCWAAYPYYYFVLPAGMDWLASVQGAPYNGQQACGVFMADWWGIKFISPDNFPGCADYLPEQVDVACLTQDGDWTTDYVSGQGAKEDVFFATVKQHGLCGIFPTQ